MRCCDPESCMTAASLHLDRGLLYGWRKTTRPRGFSFVVQVLPRSPTPPSPCCPYNPTSPGYASTYKYSYFPADGLPAGVMHFVFYCPSGCFAMGNLGRFTQRKPPASVMRQTAHRIPSVVIFTDVCQGTTFQLPWVL